MTFENKMIELLTANGLTDSQATNIVIVAKGKRTLDSMEHRWKQEIGDYPEMVTTAVWLNVKDVALEWIDKNCHKAWYRPLFAD